MSRRKKPPPQQDDAPKLEPVPERIATPFRGAFASMKIEPPKTAPKKPSAPPPRPISSDERTRKAEDRRALSSAFAGVAPLGGKPGRRITTADPPTGGPPIVGTHPAEERAAVVTLDADARARLDALVGGGVRFRVTRDEDGVLALRENGDRRALDTLTHKDTTPESSLDLHGLRSIEAAGAISRFVREQHRRGARIVRVVTGRGSHSEGGLAVLDDVAVQTLSQGGAAPFVLAFVTARARHGGKGALLVRLIDKMR